MTIEKLEALEYEGSSDRWESDVRSALANLLAVAKAAKALLLAIDNVCGEDCKCFHRLSVEVIECDEALSRLEAQ